MGRTILRNANTSDVNDISESFANFASYSGIKENKSFVNTDQNSFEESNNMYVDVDGQLSTRPPVEKHTITVLDDYTVIDIFKVNGITFYKILKDSTYYIKWKYNDNWTTVIVDDDTNVFYISSYYIFTNGETIFGYKYNYDESEWVEYTLDSLIYIPEYEIVSSTGTTTNTGALNIFTSAYKKVYNITRDSSIDTSDLVGNTIKVIVDNLEFEITWAENTQYTLVTNVGIVSADVTHIEVGFVSTANPIYIAYCDYWKLSDGHQGCYYSTDGNLWVQINFPEDSEVYSACLSEQSYTLWLQYSKFDYCNLDNTDDDYYDCILYYYTLPTSVINFTFSYSEIKYKVNTYGFGIYTTGATQVSTNEITSYVFDTTFAPMMHSVNDGQCILMFRASDANVNIYDRSMNNATYIDGSYNSGDTATGRTYKDITLCSELISTLITDTKNNTSSNYYYYVTVTEDTKINDYLILVIINNYTCSGCYASLNYPQITENSCSTNVTQMIRMYPSSLSQNIVNLYTVENDGNATYIYVYPIILNSNYEPYKTFDVFAATGGYTDNYYYRWFYGRGIGMNIFVNTSTLDDLIEYGIVDDIPSICIQTGKYMLYFASDDTNSYIIDCFEKYQDDIQTYYFAFGLNSLTSTDKFYSYGTGDFYYELSLQFTIPSNASTYVMKNSSYVISLSGDVDDIYSTSKDTYTSDIYSGMYVSYYQISYIDYTLNEETIKQITNKYASKRFFLYRDTSSSLQLLTDCYYYVNNAIYELINVEDTEFKIPLAIFSTTINNTSTYNFYYWNCYNYTIYSNDYDSAIVYFIITSSNDGNFTKNDINDVTINFAKELYTTTIGSNNLLYQCTSDPDGTGLLYVREDSKVELPDTITAMIEFSQTVIGVFTNFTAYEYTASSSDDGSVYYYLYPTKLVIGNRADYDLLQSYDGSSIYISTVKGIATLTYEELVQSTEHVFTYLTDDILNAYKEFDVSSIKFCQYLNWLFMYRQDSKICYLYDISNSAWWKWTLLDNITKIYWDTENDVLIVLMSNTLYYFNFDTDNFYDYGTEVINWNFKSQKLHFNYPNNYKHIRRVSIVTTQNTDKIRYKLKFTNYKSWEQLQDKYVVEYDIDNLNTLIQKVNFMKCNAFQFEISNDTTWKYPQKFVVSNIAIKYRVTEDIR